MTGLEQGENRRAILGEEPTIDALMQSVSSTCNGCDRCRKQCGFLERFGTPGEIAGVTDHQDRDAFALSFACSLCGLCNVVCPRNVNPADFFLEMRRAAVVRGEGRFSAHKRLLAFEARGVSPRYSWYGFPEGCHTVFFPGCALSGSRPGQTLALFSEFQRYIPGLGIALDCCTKPSHDLGRTSRFNAAFGSLRKHFLSCGIRTIITACPNCLQVFKQYGGPLHIENAYELLSTTKAVTFRTLEREVTVHDPCAVRFDTGLHDAVRKLVEKSGAQITELPNRGRKTLCCGEGGAVGHLHPDLSGRWTEAMHRQTQGRRLVTYCAGCAGFLNRVTPTEHVLDLLFSPEAGRPFGMKVSRPPMTYWNRIRLKRHLKRHLPWKISGSRPFDGKKATR